jgi:hypothetical protein
MKLTTDTALLRVRIFMGGKGTLLDLVNHFMQWSFKLKHLRVCEQVGVPLSVSSMLHCLKSTSLVLPGMNGLRSTTSCMMKTRSMWCFIPL